MILFTIIDAKKVHTSMTYTFENWFRIERKIIKSIIKIKVI